MIWTGCRRQQWVGQRCFLPIPMEWKEVELPAHAYGFDTAVRSFVICIQTSAYPPNIKLYGEACSILSMDTLTPYISSVFLNILQYQSLPYVSLENAEAF